jgi:hypothetical protein
MNKFIVCLTLFVTLLFSTMFYSCSNPVSPDPIAYYIANPPIITGIVRTGETDPSPLGIIGTPNPKSQLRNYHMEAPYPNPTASGSKIYYAIPEDTYISIWIVKGRLAGENQTDYKFYSNGYFKSPPEMFSMKLFEGVRQAGVWVIEVNAKNLNGYVLPDGFYRIYIEISGEFMWQDLMVYSGAGQEGGPY